MKVKRSPEFSVIKRVRVWNEVEIIFHDDTYRYNDGNDKLDSLIRLQLRGDEQFT